MSLLGAGALSYTVGSRRHYLAVQGGFLEVLPEHVRVLANLAERAEDIDLEQARAGLALLRSRWPRRPRAAIRPPRWTTSRWRRRA